MDNTASGDAEADAPRPATDSSVALADLASDLHQIYDPISEKSLPIYFGPLLGELFLAGR